MRSYLTRHGNGFMPNESKELNFEDQTNISHKYQGEFRQGYHSLEQIQYAIQCDSVFSGSDYSRKNLSIICLDQTESKILIDDDKVGVNDFLSFFSKFNEIICNYSPNSETMVRLKNELLLNKISFS